MRPSTDTTIPEAPRLSRRASATAVALLVAGLVAAGAASPPARGQEAGTVDIHILIYSGRPDPVLELQVSDPLLDELRALVSSAPVATGFEGSTVTPAILGYKGLRIADRSGPGGLPGHIAIYRGVVEVREDGATRFVTDGDRRLEAALLRRAVEDGVVDAGLLEAERIPPAAREPEGPEQE